MEQSKQSVDGYLVDLDETERRYGYKENLKMTKKQVEEILIAMLRYQQTLEGYGLEEALKEAGDEALYFHDIEDIKPFENYLCTSDNGVVVDLKDGTQICLTIQIR